MHHRRTVLRLALPTALVAIALVGCGGTKVYDATKTIVHNGSIYQVTDVKQISTKIEGVTPDKETIDLKGEDKSVVSDLIKQHDPLFVRMAFEMDEQELVYVADEVDSWRDYNRMLSRFEDAGDDIAKLMSETKTKQLELR